MARYRPPEYCLTCGKQLKAIYKDQSDIPLMQRVIGDTFMGYKKCDHKIEQPTPEGEKVEEESVREGLIRLRNYFGEHDRTPFEHWAYNFINNLLTNDNTQTK